MKFEEVNWHDQTLLNITIDRGNPGRADIIELTALVDESRVKILFKDVYYAELKLNFGIIAEEMIKYAINNTDDTMLFELKNQWHKLGVELDELKCFEFNTNSTNSIIKIYSLSCDICKA